MPAEFESGFFAGEAAWHKQGNVIPRDKAETLTLDELSSLAGLDWQVKQRPVFWQDEAGIFHEIQSHRANIRDLDNSCLDVPTKDYKPTQNREMLATMHGIVQAGQLIHESAGSLNEGKTIWCLARVPNAGFTLETKEGKDTSVLYALLSSGHKAGIAFRAKFTLVRVVCANTLSMAHNSDTGIKSLDGEIRLVHRSEWDGNKVARVQSFIHSGIASLDAFYSKAQLMVSTPFERKVTELAVVELLQPELLKKTIDNGVLTRPAEIRPGQTLGSSLIDQIVQKEKHVLDSDDFTRSTKRVLELVDSAPGSELGKGTAWQLLNAVTRYVDYERGRNSDSRLNAAWFGQGDNLKTRTVNHVLSYVNAVNGASTAPRASIAA